MFISSHPQTRTTSYSCSNDENDYSGNELESRPLPWVVRVLFESENSIQEKLCSGKKNIHIRNILMLI